MNSYRLALPSNVHIHPVFHVNNLRPCSTATKRPSIREDDDEYDIDHISHVKIDTLAGRRGKYMLFYNHFKEKILNVWHRLNED
jgi:hypothetical protein